VEKIQVSLKCDQNNVYFNGRRFHVFTISRRILLRMSNVSSKSCRENENTHSVFGNLFFSANCALCEVMSKNIV
jgi:hypothetical protein